MLATCHSIPGARLYLKHFGLGLARTWNVGFQGRVPLLWALVRLMLFATAQQQHYLFPPLAISAVVTAAAAAALAAATSEVLQARCSCVRHAEQVVRWLRRVGGWAGGEGGTGTGSDGGAVSAPHLNFKVGHSDSHTQKFRMKIHFFSLWISQKAQNDSCSRCCGFIPTPPRSPYPFCLFFLGRGLQLDGDHIHPILNPWHMQMYNACRWNLCQVALCSTYQRIGSLLFLVLAKGCPETIQPTKCADYGSNPRFGYNGMTWCCPPSFDFDGYGPVGCECFR